MRYKAVIEYDGTAFYGWQRQNDLLTVQQRVEESLLALSKEIVTVYGAGRTDTGVHAYGQVAHFDLQASCSAFRVMECMNHFLKDVPISVLSLEEVDRDFHARFSAKEREYVYRIVNRRSKPALQANRAWWVIKSLNVELMNDAASYLLGEHDFSAFRAQGCQSKTPIKTISYIHVKRFGEMIELKVRANAFLYHQVRNIVGSLYDVGCGKLSKTGFIDIFYKKDRSIAGVTAPACGLYFNKVYY